MTMITIDAGTDGSFEGYLALPEGGSGPGLVVLQEIFGVNDVMRRLCDEWAARGFVALCPDLFWRIEPGIQLTDKTDAEWARAFELYKVCDESLAAADAGRAIEALRMHEACTGKVGAVGFCLGGKLAYLAATRTTSDASVGFYGVGIEGALDERDNIGKPLMLHIAGQDEFCSPEAQVEIHAAFDGHDLVTLHDYPDRDHAFARPGGAHYHQGDAELATARTLAFFDQHLR